MMNFGDITKGWKVYILTWTWLGIAAGLASGSALGVAFVVWAIGASAGWLLAPTVRHKGWLVATCWLIGVPSVLLITLCVIAFMPEHRR